MAVESQPGKKKQVDLFRGDGMDDGRFQNAKRPRAERCSLFIRSQNQTRFPDDGNNKYKLLFQKGGHQGMGIRFRPERQKKVKCFCRSVFDPGQDLLSDESRLLLAKLVRYSVSQIPEVASEPRFLR